MAGGLGVVRSGYSLGFEPSVAYAVRAVRGGRSRGRVRVRTPSEAYAAAWVAGGLGVVRSG